MLRKRLDLMKLQREGLSLFWPGFWGGPYPPPPRGLIPAPAPAPGPYLFVPLVFYHTLTTRKVVFPKTGNTYCEIKIVSFETMNEISTLKNVRVKKEKRSWNQDYFLTSDKLTRFMCGGSYEVVNPRYLAQSIYYCYFCPIPHYLPRKPYGSSNVALFALKILSISFLPAISRKLLRSLCRPNIYE